MARRRRKERPDQFPPPARRRSAVLLSHLAAGRGHKTDTSETTRATSRDTGQGVVDRLGGRHRLRKFLQESDRCRPGWRAGESLLQQRGSPSTRTGTLVTDVRADSPRGLEHISRLFLCRAEQRQGRQREEQHRQEAGCDKRRVDGGTEKFELYTDLARDDQEAE